MQGTEGGQRRHHNLARYGMCGGRTSEKFSHLRGHVRQYSLWDRLGRSVVIPFPSRPLVFVENNQHILVSTCFVRSQRGVWIRGRNKYTAASRATSTTTSSSSTTAVAITIAVSKHSPQDQNKSKPMPNIAAFRGTIARCETFSHVSILSIIEELPQAVLDGEDEFPAGGEAHPHSGHPRVRQDHSHFVVSLQPGFEHTYTAYV